MPSLYLLCKEFRSRSGPTSQATCLCHLFIYFAQSLNPDHTGLHSAQQSVIFLTTDACPTACPGFAILIPVWSHTFMDIDLDIISMVIYLHSADSFKKDSCQNFLWGFMCTKYWFTACSRLPSKKSVVK